jgi:hypothetical protein
VAAPTLYLSTDASAPVLTGEVDKLVALLDAVLVNGYGAKAAAGWTTQFTGTNKRVYRPGGGVQHVWRVLDDGSVTTQAAKEAVVRGAESASDVDTLVAPFPTIAQLSNDTTVMRKSATADATARAWVALADDRTLMLFVLSGDTAGAYQSMYIGEFLSYVSGDLYRSCTVTSSGSGSSGSNNLGDLQSSFVSASSGHYVPRGYTGTGGSLNVGKHGDNVLGNSAALFGIVSYPNGPDSGIYVSPVYLHEGNPGHVRGELRGLFQFLHAIAGVADRDTFSGSGPFAGRTFLILKAAVESVSAVFTLETTAWAKN